MVAIKSGKANTPISSLTNASLSRLVPERSVEISLEAVARATNILQAW